MNDCWADVDATLARTDSLVGKRLTLADARNAVIEARDGASNLLRPDIGGLMRMGADEMASKHSLVAAAVKAAAVHFAAEAPVARQGDPVDFAAAVDASLE